MNNQAITRCRKANAIGVNHLLLGNHGEAVNAFTHALQIAKRILDKLDESRPGDNGITSEIQIMAFPFRRRDECENSASKVSAFQLLQQGGGQFAYTTPLQIMGAEDSWSRDGAVGVSVAIIFNLALSHHLLALNNRGLPPHRDEVFRQAISLYEVAYTMLIQEGDVLCIESTLAIINNLGQIHATLREQEKASRCFKHLLSTILFVQSGGEEIESADVFFQSVSHLILREVVAPAA